MTPEFVYLALLNVSLFALGAAAASLGILIRHRPRRWWAYALVKAGLATIVGTLMFVVWGNGTVEPSARAGIYILGVLGSAVGMSFVAGDLAKRGGTQSAVQVVQDIVDDQSGQRVTKLEDRVTAEEARNTDIEELARQHKAGTEDDPSEVHEAEEEKR